jgi:two-component system response regulator AtoC
MPEESNRGRPIVTISSQAATRHQLSRQLADLGFAATEVSGVEEALAEVSRGDFAVTMLPLKGVEAHGPELVRRLWDEGGHPGAIIVVADRQGLEQNAGTTTAGAPDILPRPLTAADSENTINSARTRSRRGSGLPAAEDPLPRLHKEMGLWRSQRMQEVRRIIDQAARIDVTVLIGGETGVGKDVVARAIHGLSPRQTRPFVKMNCAAVPRDLLESELFGHERGAFTGADRQKIGKFEAADHGTIFLDEIGDLHPALQGKLLHVLQDGQFSRVGGRSTIKVDVRVLAATNQDLEAAVATGRFREDLYYRLNVIQINVPPLRERPEDIPVLVEYFFERFGRLFGREGMAPPPDMIHQLLRQRLPGNVRELENIVKRMIVLGNHAGEASVASAARTTPAGLARTSVSLREIGRQAALAAERLAMLRVLEETHWNRVKAAKLLGISYRALLYKIKDAALEPAARSSHPRP